MPNVPDDWGLGGSSDGPFWLAVGDGAADALRAHGAAFFEDDAPAIEVVDDVHGALVLLAHRRTLGCVVSGDVLDARPREALGLLQREVRPGPMLVYASGRESLGVRDAARDLGIHIWEAKSDSDDKQTATATAPPPEAPDRPHTPITAEPEPPEPAPSKPIAPMPPDAAQGRRSGRGAHATVGEEQDKARARARAKQRAEALPRADDDRPAPSMADPGRFAEGCLQRIGRLRPLVRYTVRTLSEVSNASRISLMLSEPERATLRLHEGRGVRESLVGRVRCAYGTGIAGRVAALGRPVTGHGSPGGAREYTGRAYVVLPLGSGRQCEGVVCLTGLPDDQLPDGPTVRSWAKLARRAGVALRGARTLRRARSLAVHDELTRLPNRRAFERGLSRELERARRGGTRLVVGLFDVDHFKSFNDRHGHAVGDVVLREVARRLQAAFRETDLVTRWGGEEFAVLLPGIENTEEAHPRDLMERGWAAIRARPFQLGPQTAPARVTVSGGFAIFPRDGVDPQKLLDLADAGLYEAKAAGRDRVHGTDPQA